MRQDLGTDDNNDDAGNFPTVDVDTSNIQATAHDDASNVHTSAHSGSGIATDADDSATDANDSATDDNDSSDDDGSSDGGSISDTEDTTPEDCQTEESSSTSQDESYVPPWLDDMSIHAPSVLFATTADILKFVNQFNSVAPCTTNGCKGQLVPAGFFLKGRGGTARLDFKCSGCGSRELTLDSSSSSNVSRIPNLSLALRVASIAAGCRYAVYDKMFHKYMGMDTVSHRCFHNTFKLLYRPVKELLDAMCEAAKQQMKDMPQNQLGSWSRAVTAGDGVWLTRGCHSQNATFTLRNHVTGALLYYEHMCQRGDDTVTEEQLFEGTSKAAEGHGADNAFRKAYEEGMNIDIHWQDGDSTSANALHKHFNDAKVFLCSGHVAKNHEKRLNNHYSTTNHNGVQCHCVNKGKAMHRVQPNNYCGCFNKAFTKRAKRNLVQILNNVGTDVEKFQRDIRNLAKYHVRNIHQWEEYDFGTGSRVIKQCNFHPLMVCSCDKKCPPDSLQCSGKPYRPHIVLTCPLHTMLYEKECQHLANLAPTIIHPVLGKGSTNMLETSHSVLTRFRAKDWNIKKLHYIVSTNMGLIQTNMPWCYENRGPEYHWITDLYGRMNIPTFGDMPNILKKSNVRRRKMHVYKTSEETKKKATLALKRHRGAEQRARKNWSNKQNAAYAHDYRDESDVEYQIPTKQRKTDGGSERVASKRAKKQVKGDLSVFHFSESSDGSLPSGSDNCLSDSSLAVGQVIKESLCTCGGGSSHSRSCPANMRNFRSHQVPSTIPEPDVSKPVSPPREDSGGSVSLPDRASSTPNADKDLELGSIESACVDSSDELTILGVEFTASCPVVGNPEPTAEWKSKACAFLTELIKKNVGPKDQRINKVKSPNLPAEFIRDKIAGDGNCLFRAIAKAVTGTEAHHLAVREAVCDFMMLDSNVHDFRPLTLSRDDSDPRVVVGNYIKKRKLRKNKEWGTDVEIRVAATMFQINIFVSLVGGFGVRSFVPYRPVFVNNTCMPPCDPMPCIYLYHVDTPGAEHYDLVHLPS